MLSISLTPKSITISDAKTWTAGDAVPLDMHGPVAEPSLAELSNGSIVMNMVSPPACKRVL